ncbi:hypothetical protein DVW08_12705 [Clostridium botulinum]|nr:hypothetical protein [Clostridium botulinum]
MLIYKVINKINNKIYIGQTTQTIERRWEGHLYDCKKAKNNKFYNAINKYGKENFKIEIVENDISSQALLNEREIYWIKFYDSYKSGYNSTLGGEESPMHYKAVREKVSSTNKGRVFSEEHRKKISIAHKGKPGTPYTEKHKRYMSKILTGRKVSIDTRNKLRIINLGKKQSIETRLKRSNSMKGRKSTEEHKRKISTSLKENSYSPVGKENVKSKPVLQVDIKTGEILKKFESACLAENYMGKPKNWGSIIRVANGQRKSAYGYKWIWKK